MSNATLHTTPLQIRTVAETMSDDQLFPKPHRIILEDRDPLIVLRCATIEGYVPRFFQFYDELFGNTEVESGESVRISSTAFNLSGLYLVDPGRIYTREELFKKKSWGREDLKHLKKRMVDLDCDHLVTWNSYFFNVPYFPDRDHLISSRVLL